MYFTIAKSHILLHIICI